MPERIGVFVAWPYANGDWHVGHVAGSYLPADIFARYHRLKGNEVLMVSGSDSHGTPVTVAAEAEGTTPLEVFSKYHRRFLQTAMALGLTYDLFTHTDTLNHQRLAHHFLERLEDEGFLYESIQQILYCETDQRFLPDRYVEGECPHCGYVDARGDQCDNCGRPLDQLELLAPRCKLCGTTPVVRDTKHLFFDLRQFNDPLHQWVERQHHWKSHVRNFTLGWLREGLKGRPITRDIEWGIPVPRKGYEHKRFYVWFEAVMGYLSASMEWAKVHGQPEAWQAWWREEARGYYFLGKDNIFFHTLIWPAMLMGHEALNLPYNVPANQYLNLPAGKMSKSRGVGLVVREMLEHYEPDALRYYLTAIMPEQRDTEWSWDDLVRRNNDELLAAWGNLAHRLLTFSQSRFEGRIPDPGGLEPRDRELLATVEGGFDRVGRLYETCQFAAALREAIGLAREVNRYLDEQAPWKAIKEDPSGAARAVYVGLQAVDHLKTLLAPVLPHTSARLQRALGHERPLFGEQYTRTLTEENGREHDALLYRPLGDGAAWAPQRLEPGRPLPEPEPLIRKLEPAAEEGAEPSA